MKIISLSVLANAEGRDGEPIEAGNLMLRVDSGLVFEITQGPEPNSIRIRTNGEVADEDGTRGGMYGRGRLVVAPDCSNTITVHAVESGWTWADREENER